MRRPTSLWILASRLDEWMGGTRALMDSSGVCICALMAPRSSAELPAGLQPDDLPPFGRFLRAAGRRHCAFGEEEGGGRKWIRDQGSGGEGG